MKALLALALTLAPAAAIADPEFYRFVRDDRPSDGALVEVMLSAAGETGFTATLHVESYDRRQRRKVADFRTLGEGLVCEIIHDGHGFHSAECDRDDRPVDGILTELKVVRGADRLYTVTLRTAYVDREQGREVVRDETIGQGLRSVGALGSDAGTPKNN